MFTRARLLAAALGLAATTTPAAFAQNDAEPFDLPLRHLTLYSSGVGHYTHAGPVPGGDTEFTFSAEQLNDVLKSLLVRGANGSVAVSYPGQEPLAQRLADFGIDVSHAESLPDLLRQLRGVELTLAVRGDAEPVKGRLLGINTEHHVVDDKTTLDHFLNLATDAGLRRLDLDQVDNLQIDDPGLRAELNKALALLGATRKQDSKPLTLSFDKPSDQAAVSYLLEAPLWKLSYRLDLTETEDAEGPLLQGWAIVDNTTDADWDTIDVTLVSGRPVSFVQNLYSPEYLKRPVVVQERYAGLRPQQYGQGVMLADQDVDNENGVRDELSSVRRAVARRAAGRESLMAGESAPTAPASAADAYFAGAAFKSTSGIDPTASAGDLGDLFAYHIDQPVTVPRGGSAMLPIVNETVEATPLSIYNPSVQPKHPMRGVRLTNTTDLKLDAGPVTVLDAGSYAGDAQLGFIAPGDDRLLSYGLDLEVTMDAAANSSSTFATANIARGVLVITHTHRYTQTYEARNAAGDDRQLLIEHPRQNNRELLEPEIEEDSDIKIEKTDALYRFPLTVPAGKTAKLEVIESEPRVQYVQLVRQNADQLAAYVRNGRFPKEVRDALTEAVSRQRDLEQTRREIGGIEKLNAEITAEQDRIRRNMGSVDRNSALYRRYVEKLNAQETQLENHAEQLDALRKRLAEQEKALADYLEGLNVE